MGRVERASLSVLTKNLDAALAVWADVVQNPSFTEKEFARVRDNVLTAIARRKDSPPTIAMLAMSRVLYGDQAPVRLADDRRRGVAEEDDRRRPAQVLRQPTTTPTTRC